MKAKLSLNETFLIGSMLFGLFFGAGNIIFPLMLGQQAGNQYFLAAIGFIITAVGLPLLGVNALGTTKKENLYELSSHINPLFGKIFTLILYFTIGPLFAIPRLATTSFEVGVKPLINIGSESLLLLVFSALFFLCVWYLSLKPGQIINIVGKYINPSFLLLIGALIVVAFLNPMGSTVDQIPQGPYVNRSFFQGLQDGYQTMDAIASLAFGIIVINAIRKYGIQQDRQITKSVLLSGIIASIMMILIYFPLIWIGVNQLGVFEPSSNGGEMMAKVSTYYFGSLGQIILLLIITLACLKTGIGLITATSGILQVMFPRIKSYTKVVTVLTILSFLIANIGLESIISLSLPVLFLIYPLAIVVILLANFAPSFNNHPQIYQVSLLATLPFALLDYINATSLKDQFFFPELIGWMNQYWPLFEEGLGWLLPAILTCGLALLFIRPWKNNM